MEKENTPPSMQVKEYFLMIAASIKNDTAKSSNGIETAPVGAQN